MLKELRDDRGLELAEVGKVDVIHGRLVAEDHDGKAMLDEPIKDFHGAALKGCDECADFLGPCRRPLGRERRERRRLLERPHPHRRRPAGVRPRRSGSSRSASSSKPEALERLDRLDKKVAVSALQRSSTRTARSSSTSRSTSRSTGGRTGPPSGNRSVSLDARRTRRTARLHAITRGGGTGSSSIAARPRGGPPRRRGVPAGGAPAGGDPAGRASPKRGGRHRSRLQELRGASCGSGSSANVRGSSA